jgi:carboxypeptidase C (cathepsin A)
MRRSRFRRFDLFALIFRFRLPVRCHESGKRDSELPYILALPSMAATSWYHHKVPNQPAQLEPFRHEVEDFALGDYSSALLKGADISTDQQQAIAGKLQGYTGIPAAYWIKANLRVSGADFSKELQTDAGLTTGRLDARYQGPDIDPLSKEAEYDPFSNSIMAAYVTVINQYAREDLKYGENQTYKPSARQPGFTGTWTTRRPVAVGENPASTSCPISPSP